MSEHTTNAPVIGRCPHCRASLTRGNVLIRYDRADGDGVFAECPDCREVVHPA